VLPSNYRGVPLKGEGEGASRGHMVVLLRHHCRHALLYMFFSVVFFI
jgi:hypothetical protein